eukprot:TRINITY_DN16000_c0_g1_i1.p1 TRINITY_DN16000_c0_g1~~TRINITY_DN16000_c0_g1_i1.p1  ORF type:complete len:674 (+),score=92.94 TRINITY_DN16000_c0_g1_i1:115-2136(+)
MAAFTKIAAVILSLMLGTVDAQLEAEIWFSSSMLTLSGFPQWGQLGLPNVTDQWPVISTVAPAPFIYYNGPFAGQPFPQQDDIFIRLTGFIDVPADAIYSFLLGSDDQSELYVDGSLIIQMPLTQQYTQTAADIQLSKGHHEILVHYVEQQGVQALTLDWNATGTMQTVDRNSFIVPKMTDIPDTIIPTPVPTDVPETVAPTIPPTTVPTVISNVTSLPTTVPTIPTPTVTLTMIPSQTMLVVDPTLIPTTIPVVETIVPTSNPTSIPTSSPDHQLTTAITDNKETIDSAATASAIASSFGIGASAASATRLVLISGECVYSNDDRQYPFLYHPTKIVIAGSRSLGLIVGNVIIMLSFWALSFLLFKTAKFIGERFFPTKVADIDTQGLVRFPSSPLFVFFFFYQGTSLGGLVLIVGAETWFEFLAGVPSTMVCLLVPLLLVRQLRRDVTQKAVYAMDCERKKNSVQYVLLGPGEWVSRFRKPHWIQRYKSAVKAYRVEYSCFVGIEMVSMFCIACTMSFPVNSLTQCGHVKMTQAVIMSVMLALEGMISPHCRIRDFVINFVTLGLQAGSLLFQAIGNYQGDTDHFTFSIAAKLLHCCLISTVVRSTLDILCEVYVIFSGSRTRLQEAQWRASESRNVHQNQSFYSLPDFSRQPSLLNIGSGTTVRSDEVVL